MVSHPRNNSFGRLRPMGSTEETLVLSWSNLSRRHSFKSRVLCALSLSLFQVMVVSCGAQGTSGNVPEQVSLVKDGSWERDFSQGEPGSGAGSESGREAGAPSSADANERNKGTDGSAQEGDGDDTETPAVPPNDVGSSSPEQSRPDAPPPFTDIADDARRFEIAEAYARGIARGRTAMLFEPSASLTREELAAMIFNALKDFEIETADQSGAAAESGPVAEVETPTFPDVSPDRWSYRAISTLARLGIMSGTTSGGFEPTSAVTRAQAVVAVWGAVQKARRTKGAQGELPAVVPRTTYQDLVGHWAQSRVVEMSGFCRADEGTEGGSQVFDPNTLSSRSHAVGVIVRSLLCHRTGALPSWASRSGNPPPQKPVPSADVLSLCETTDKAARARALESLARLAFGTRAMNLGAMPKSHDRCVLEMLPGALYTNLKTGVPASILIGQAIQETGWCGSELAQRGRNYHGQKAKFDTSHFTYWKGDSIEIYSSESPTGGGRLIKSRFMAFAHPDHSFYSVAERFKIPGLPYQSCLARRSDSVGFIRCVGKSWAVHSDYADLVLDHRTNFRSSSRPSLRLGMCDLKPAEWSLDPSF